MSSYGGKGRTLNAVLWTETAIGALFVLMRIYTRKFILRSAGWDDAFLFITLVGASPSSDCQQTISSSWTKATSTNLYSSFFLLRTHLSSPQRHSTVSDNTVQTSLLRTTFRR
jgi:hypothetical protein